MTMFRVGPAGIPGSLKTDMNTVLNKKFGTTAQDYPPADWPADVNLLGPLPVKTASGAIASFPDGADDVPLASASFGIVPAGGGGTPSDPVAITGYSGMTISHAKNLLLPNPTDSSASTTNGVTRSYSATTQEFILSGTNEKTDAAWLIANWSNETIAGLKVGATYTFSHNLSNDCYAQITYYDTNGSTKTLVSLAGNASKNASIQFTVPGDYDRPRNFQLGIYRTATTIDEQAHFMINGGSTAFSFSKYVTPATISDTFGRTVYGGTRALDGTLTETYGIITFTGAASETWGNYSVHNGYYIDISDMMSGTRQAGACNMLTLSTSSASGQTNSFWLGVGNTRLYVIGVYDSMGNTIEAFKTFLSNNPLVITFPLATPNTYALDSIAMSSYYGANNIYTDIPGSSNTIDYRADIQLALNQ